jgi:hypothetical protein
LTGYLSGAYDGANHKELKIFRRIVVWSPRGRKMLSRTALILLVAVAIGIAPRPAAAIFCIHPTWCYCQLVPGECDALIKAEVTAIEDASITLLVLEEPFYDPEDLVTSGMELTLNTQAPGWTGMVVGQRGLFMVHHPGTCSQSEPDEPYLEGALAESNGTYPCSTYPSFAATNEAALIAVILGGNCDVDALQMMGIEHYCEGESGCCYGSASVGGTLPMLLLGLTLLRRGRR